MNKDVSRRGSSGEPSPTRLQAPKCGQDIFSSSLQYNNKKYTQHSGNKSYWCPTVRRSSSF
eukprot:2267318-Amphidinium_carterae.1